MVKENKKFNYAMGSYFFSKQDTYIRTEIVCQDGTIYFLNPVLRFEGVKLADYAPSNNVLKTWAWRTAVFVVLVFTFIIWNHKKVNV